jgi:hypothetical protein
MHMRTALGSIVVGGLIGALLWTGLVGAQQAPSGLPACQASLKTCQTNLGKCNTALTVCEAEPDVVFPGDGVDGPALSYHDNGDGTFTDNNTLLMWEKKVLGVSVDTCSTTTNLHGADSTCTWAEATGAWIAAINAANLGGHSDWRIPNIKELQSIVDYSKSNPASSVPGSTAANDFLTFYWSATTIVTNPIAAWTVDFISGDLVGWLKSLAFPVRAVRGGR